MLRPASIRLAGTLTSSARTVSRQPILRPSPCLAPARPLHVRTLATQSPAPGTTPPPPPPPPPSTANHTPMWIVLGALVALAGGGYFYLKPIRDVAQRTNQALDSVKGTATSVSNNTGLIAEVAKSMLPPGVFAVYSHLSSQPGGIDGFLSSLKDQDLNSTLEQLKNAGGDDVKRVVQKVQTKLKEAKGKASDIDWKSLAAELKAELGPKGQQAIDLLIGKIPSQDDINALIQKAKSIGEDQLKQVEASASKVLKQVEKARKDGKDNADAFFKGLKEAAPADVDQLIQQLKDAAKKAGLPADTIESYLKTKGSEGKADVEATAKQLTEKLKSASKLIPGDPKDLIQEVKEFSPSLANLLALALENAGITDKDGNKKK